MGLGRAYRALRRALPDPDLDDGRAGDAAACRTRRPGAAGCRGPDVGEHRRSASALCRLSGRRRRHGAGRLRQLRNARRLRRARSARHFGQRQDRARALRRRMARPQAEAGAGTWRGWLPHLFRPGRRQLWRGRRLSQGRRAARNGNPARLGRRHADLSRRSADARRRRDSRSEASDPRRSQDHPQDPDASDFVPRRDQDHRLAPRPARHRQSARRAGNGLSLGRHRRRSGASSGQVRLVAEAGL